MRSTSLALGISGMLLAGCQTGKPTPDHATIASEPLTQQHDLSDALALWRAGEVDDAVQMYVSVASHKLSREQDLLLFDLTEAEFSALPADEQTRLLQQWLDRSRDLRRLTRAVLESDSGTASLAVERVGRVHAESDRALIAQKTGEAILRGLEAKNDSQ